MMRLSLIVLLASVYCINAASIKTRLVCRSLGEKSCGEGNGNACKCCPGLRMDHNGNCVRPKDCPHYGGDGQSSNDGFGNGGAGQQFPGGPNGPFNGGANGGGNQGPGQQFPGGPNGPFNGGANGGNQGPGQQFPGGPNGPFNGGANGGGNLGPGQQFPGGPNGPFNGGANGEGNQGVPLTRDQMMAIQGFAGQQGLSGERAQQFKNMMQQMLQKWIQENPGQPWQNFFKTFQSQMGQNPSGNNGGPSSQTTRWYNPSTMAWRRPGSMNRFGSPRFGQNRNSIHGFSSGQFGRNSNSPNGYGGPGSGQNWNSRNGYGGPGSGQNWNSQNRYGGSGSASSGFGPYQHLMHNYDPSGQNTGIMGPHGPHGPQQNGGSPWGNSGQQNPNGECCPCTPNNRPGNPLHSGQQGRQPTPFGPGQDGFPGSQNSNGFGYYGAKYGLSGQASFGGHSRQAKSVAGFGHTFLVTPSQQQATHISVA